MKENVNENEEKKENLIIDLREKEDKDISSEETFKINRNQNNIQNEIHRSQNNIQNEIQRSQNNIQNEIEMTNQNLPSISTYIKSSYDGKNLQSVNLKKCCIECFFKGECCICNNKIIKCGPCQINEVEMGKRKSLIEQFHTIDNLYEHNPNDSSYISICPRKCCSRCFNKDGCCICLNRNFKCENCLKKSSGCFCFRKCCLECENPNNHCCLCNHKEEKCRACQRKFYSFELGRKERDGNDKKIKPYDSCKITIIGNTPFQQQPNQQNQQNQQNQHHSKNLKLDLILLFIFFIVLTVCSILFRSYGGFTLKSLTVLYIMILGLYIYIGIKKFLKYFKH